MRRVTLLLAVLLAGGARAGCSLTGSAALAFGTYDPFSATPTDSWGSVTLQCSGLVGLVTVDLSAGQSGNLTARALRSGANTLSYGVYLDVTRLLPMGDGTGGTSHYGPSVVALNVPVTFLFYGRVPARQVVAPGTYGDTLVVTVSF